MSVEYPSLEVVDAAPIFMIEMWYRTLPQPKTPDEEIVLERVCLRNDGCKGDLR